MGDLKIHTALCGPNPNQLSSGNAATMQLQGMGTSAPLS